MNRLKEILSFLKWQIRQWKWHDYLWFAACFMVSFDFENKGTVFVIGITIAVIMILSTLTKWQWNNWKREREELLKTIKDGK